ncbi:hypothetical protein [Candidatus Methylobacter favarea]|nr:hypothetical protein [Candidatus Methylobacter favarea]
MAMATFTAEQQSFIKFIAAWPDHAEINPKQCSLHAIFSNLANADYRPGKRDFFNKNE